jgi:3-oxoacyl-(acyl-carrier-protein) synthase
LKNPVDPALSYAMKNEDLKQDYVMKNGFVFGGINCSILFKKYT